MTAVLGHLTGLEFTAENKNWSHPPPESLFSAPVVTVVPQVRLLPLNLGCLDSDSRMCRTRRPLRRTLSGRLGTASFLSSGLIVIERESTLEKKSSMLPRKATTESLSSVPLSATSNERKPGPLFVTCECLSLTICSHILTAARRLTDLDQKQVDAVDARIELDLRIGYAFTRFLTISLRPLGGALQERTISYGKLARVLLFVF